MMVTTKAWQGCERFQQALGSHGVSMRTGMAGAGSMAVVGSITGLRPWQGLGMTVGGPMMAASVVLLVSSIARQGLI